jgi:hypothetical protein
MLSRRRRWARRLAIAPWRRAFADAGDRTLAASVRRRWRSRRGGLRSLTRWARWLAIAP